MLDQMWESGEEEFGLHYREERKIKCYREECKKDFLEWICISEH